MPTDRSQAMDHVVVVLFENRSLDNMLGHLYRPDDGKTFEGVLESTNASGKLHRIRTDAGRKILAHTEDVRPASPAGSQGAPQTATSTTQAAPTESEDSAPQLGA